MTRKMVSFGFNIYTLPVRAAYRGTAHLFNLPPTLEDLIAELRAGSEQVSREVEAMLSEVDREMTEKASHLSPQQRQAAAQIALDAAGQHLSMAAINMLRAFWLVGSSRNTLHQDEAGKIEPEVQ